MSIFIDPYVNNNTLEYRRVQNNVFIASFKSKIYKTLHLRLVCMRVITTLFIFKNRKKIKSINLKIELYNTALQLETHSLIGLIFVYISIKF